MTLGHWPVAGTLECSAIIQPSICFSICTLVSRRDQYGDMVSSFRRAGFHGNDVEYLYLDNSNGNIFDAYSGLNWLLGRARGSRIILCHQDIILHRDGRRELEARLEELDISHPDWALAGNAGGTAKQTNVLRITDPHGADQRHGVFPEQVVSLDENFIVLRACARIGPSYDLSGFHLYGTDLCNNARAAGYTAWVIDFHLQHLSKGRIDETYFDALSAIEAKAFKLLQPRRIKTTCMTVFMTASRMKRAFLVARRARKRWKRLGKIRLTGAE